MKLFLKPKNWLLNGKILYLLLVYNILFPSSLYPFKKRIQNILWKCRVLLKKKKEKKNSHLTFSEALAKMYSSQSQEIFFPAFNCWKFQVKVKFALTADPRVSSLDAVEPWTQGQARPQSWHFFWVARVNKTEILSQGIPRCSQALKTSKTPLSKHFRGSGQLQRTPKPGSQSSGQLRSKPRSFESAEFLKKIVEILTNNSFKVYFPSLPFTIWVT